MQHMSPEQPLHAQAEYGYSGSHAEQEYNRQRPIDPLESGTFSQGSAKIQPPTSGRASAGQRLALAIVSVSIIGLIGIVIASNPLATIGSYFVLGIITLAILLINGFYHRWGMF
jgi:hypothetical protein